LASIALIITITEILNAFQSEQSLAEKVKELEDKLFLMDEEFEKQTEKVRKQYDKRMWDEVARVTEKVKTDYQYKLEIKVEEEKARLLQQQLTLVNQGTKRGELAELRLRQTQIEDDKAKLEQALKHSQTELDKIQNLSQKKGWWPF
jgi:DNA repair exonuclease SbcCD ATPase subunit